LFPAEVAKATYPGPNRKNGKIVFAAHPTPTASAFDLFSIRADGTKRKRLTRTKAHESEPTFSPRGRVVAYQKGFKKIFRMQADGTRQTFIGEGMSPTFSPDGEVIAFHDDETGEISKMRATDGGDVQPVTPDDDEQAYDPSWGPSNKIAFTECCGSEGNYLWTVRPDGSNQHLVGSGAVQGSAPDWSPGGSKIAYVGYEDDRFVIRVLNADGTNNHVVKGGGERLSFEDVVWSPNGKWLLFVVVDRIDEGDPPHIAVVKKDGTGYHIIPHTAGGLYPIWQPR
jgi:TolB protein